MTDADPAAPVEDDSRPWERSGAVRRDCEPDRSGLLLTLATVSILCGVVPFSSPLGLFLGLVTWRLARRDLARMRAGLMDPAGRPHAETSRVVGFTAVLFGVCYGTLGLALGLLIR